MGSFCQRSIRALFRLAVVLGVIPGASAAGGPAWVGSGSCAATACHGGRREPLVLEGSEYAFWGAYDPHNRAFSVLYDDRSLRIERSLKRLADIESARPFENDLCLKCHVHQNYETGKAGRQSPDFAIADGVGCESCHGPAGGYLIPHVEAGWATLTDRQKLDGFGLKPTKDLLARGRICAECHVGQGVADVNHDLIAAGHPRLAFEYGSQLAKVPKHWRAEDDRARHPDFEAKVWALGQILTARASLDLLETRALRAIPEDSPAPWPEFAEFGCFSCHHELAALPRIRPDDRPGSPTWGSWTLPRAGSMASDFLGAEVASLAPLRDLMARPGPDPAVVARRARAASEELGERAEAINRGRIGPEDLRNLLAGTLKDDPAPGPLDWDLAAGRYLAIIALDKALGDLGGRPSSPRAKAELGRMLADLDLPNRSGRRGEVFDSPRSFDPARIGDDLRAVREALSPPGRTK